MRVRRWLGMAALLLFVVAGLTGCGPAVPASQPAAESGLAETQYGTVPLATENRAALAEKYDSIIDTAREYTGVGNDDIFTITKIHALEGSPYKETVWNWIRAAREELTDVPGAVTEAASVSLGYLSVRLSVFEPGAEDWSEPFQTMPSIRNRTAVFDLETGRRLSLPDLFYENIPVAELINNRLLKAVGDTELKRPFTGFPADYPHFGLAYDSYTKTGQLIFYCDKGHPFWPYDSLRIDLACYASPAGKYYYDVSYERLTTAAGQETMVPAVTFNDGTMPDADAAVNEAVQGMIPSLRQAEMVFYPYLSIEDSRFSIMYLERDYIMMGGGTYLTAAVPGCTYTYDLKTGGPVSLEKDIPEDSPREYYELTGKANPYITGETEFSDDQQQSFGWGEYTGLIVDYTPPDGSVLSDYTRQYSVYFATLTEPSGRRVLVKFLTPPDT